MLSHVFFASLVNYTFYCSLCVGRTTLAFVSQTEWLDDEEAKE